MADPNSKCEQEKRCLIFATVLKMQGGEHSEEAKQLSSNKAERRRNHFIIAALLAGVLIYLFLGQNVVWAAVGALAVGFLAQQFWD